MCSSRGLCGDSDRPPGRSSRSGGSGSGAHYALCALAVGLIALGIVMIVWTMIPQEGETSGNSSSTAVNSNTTESANNDEEEDADKVQSSSVALVLVGVGTAMLLLSICLGVRNKRRAQDRSRQPASVEAPYVDRVAGEGEADNPTTYGVPSYEEAVGSGQYPVRQSNLHQSTSQLPSYEDIIAAVENEGAEPANNPAEEAPPTDAPANPAPAAAEPQADPAEPAANPNQPARSSSRASRILRPLRVRRIKSDKLHLKDFRLQIRSPTRNPVTIEPITPPPLYDDKAPELG